MKLKYAACGMLAALALTACGSGTPAESAPPAATKSAVAQKSGKVKVVYGEVTKNQDLAAVKDEWEQDKGLEGIGDMITGLLKLPSDITVEGKECGEENAFWQPDTKTLTLCYEVQPWMEDTFAQSMDEKQAKEKASNAVMGIILHELGHATVSLYNLPITGKEEDAVDQLATVLLAKGGDDTAEMALDFGEFWQILASQSDLEDLDFADEHSTDDQRAYNVMCWVLGSNPDKFTDVLVGSQDDGLLPESRAQRCPEEYAQIEKAWMTLLKPHLAA
ncbi:DUF4344 domain-containing metallopeptidase [Nonomuraea sp. NPDC050536]|uniref:DUF4344 domain-containing metallopeptidase n=1 Tax=Nonomuraea sp. NPDC050536 TaxID=3364366 RepID=UPI0037C8A544